MERQKYPRTRHLPSSRSATEDDKIATVEQVNAALFGEDGLGRRVVITEKMDGENTTIYADGHSHARSIDSKFHPSRSIVRELSGLVSHELPGDFRICGENIYAVHSIEYSDLLAHFQVFGIWRGETCLSWDETVEWSELLGLTTVPVIYDGPWRGEAHAISLWEDFKASLPAGRESEGFVVRLAEEFTYESFRDSCFKLVRHNHVQTDEHWLHQAMRVNGLA